MSEREQSCECIERIDAMLAEHNTRVTLPWFGPQIPFIETMKADQSKRGKPKKLFASFCPFCGVKYTDSKSPKQSQ